VNTLKNIFQLNWNQKLFSYISCVIGDNRLYIAFKPVLAHANCVFDIAGLGEIGENRAVQLQAQVKDFFSQTVIDDTTSKAPPAAACDRLPRCSVFASPPYLRDIILYYATEAAHTQYNHTQSIKQ